MTSLVTASLECFRKVLLSFSVVVTQDVASISPGRMLSFLKSFLVSEEDPTSCSLRMYRLREEHLSVLPVYSPDPVGEKYNEIIQETAEAKYNVLSF